MSPLARRILAAPIWCAALVAVPGDARAQDGRLAAADSAQADSLAHLPRGARAAIAMPGVRWRSRATPRVVVYAKRGSKAERRLAALVTASDRAAAANLRWLAAPKGGEPIRLFFVDTRDEMIPLTSARTRGWSLGEEGTAFVVADPAGAPIRHEVMDLLTWRLWGPPDDLWLSEGVARYAIGRCRGYAVEDIGAALGRAGALVPLDTLRGEVDFVGRAGTERQLQAASLVSYIDQTYGRRRLRTFWQNGGLDGVKRSLGIDAPTLEKRWRATIARRKPSTAWPRMWTRIQTRGCD